jgi:hypothetical protein
MGYEILVSLFVVILSQSIFTGTGCLLAIFESCLP